MLLLARVDWVHYLFAVPLGLLSLFLARNYQRHDRLFPQLYTTVLAPPALRVAPTVATDRFIDEARTLKTVLDAHIADDDPDIEEP